VAILWLPASPWLEKLDGAMVLSKFAAQHNSRVRILSEKLYEAFVQEDGGEMLARTGRLMRANTLRTKKTRKMVGVVLKAQTHNENGTRATDIRFWSKSVVAHALQKMVKDYRIEVPMLPGFTWGSWVKEQASLVQSLCKKASRNRRDWGRRLKRPDSMSSVDSMPTMPYEVQDFFFHVSVHV
jgi:hypothetical protein